MFLPVEQATPRPVAATQPSRRPASAAREAPSGAARGDRAGGSAAPPEADRAAKQAAQAGRPKRPRSGPADPAPAAAGGDLGRLFAAIRAIESLDGKKPTGDNGRSRGPYHIGRRYWEDGCKFAQVRWSYTRHVWSRARCERVMLWYWRRYCAEALQDGNLEALARTHNGGPAGARKRSTIPYWRKVRAEMDRLRRGAAGGPPGR